MTAASVRVRDTDTAADTSTGTRILFHCEGDERGLMRDAVAEALGPRYTLVTRCDPDEVSRLRYAIVWQPPPEFFDGATSLAAVFSLGAGVDQLLRHPGLPDEVPVIRLDDAGMGRKMAEYVLHGVLHAHRQWPRMLAAAADRRWVSDVPVKPAERFQVGILGAGTLATAVARRLAANHYPVSCWSRSEHDLPDGIESVAGKAALHALLPRCDVLVCLLPLTAATTGILSSDVFDALPCGAFLINVARGEHLVEADLIDALDRGQLAGAMLDVFAQEPLPQAHPFWKHSGVLVSPHLSAPSGTCESARQVADSLSQLEAGARPAGWVDRSRGY